MTIPGDTSQLQAWRSSRPLRFRATRAYWLTLRILAGYLWLRLWKPLLGPSLYNRRLAFSQVKETFYQDTLD